MRKAYIAGPMRGYEKYNFPAFDAAAEVIRKAGGHPISPASIDRLYDGWGEAPPEDYILTEEDKRRYMMRDLRVIAYELVPERGDFVYFLRGWKRSYGARLEFHAAQFFGLPTILQPSCDLEQKYMNLYLQRGITRRP